MSPSAAKLLLYGAYTLFQPIVLRPTTRPAVRLSPKVKMRVGGAAAASTHNDDNIVLVFVKTNAKLFDVTVLTAPLNKRYHTL